MLNIYGSRYKEINVSHKQGIFTGVPASEYHKDPAIGSSSLVEAEKSLLHFNAALTGKKVVTESMSTGTWMHDLCLEQNIKHYAPRPLNEDGSLLRSNSKDYKAWESSLGAGVVPIHPDKYNEMSAILDAFCANKRAMSMMNASTVETSIFTVDPVTGLNIKARPDMMGPGFLIDLKTTSNISRFEYQIFEKMYDVRLVHYAKCIEFATGEKVNSFYFIALEQSAPYGSKIFRLKPADIARAESKWRILMNKVSVGMKGDIWPGYSDDIIEVTRPRFFEEEVITFESTDLGEAV